MSKPANLAAIKADFRRDIDSAKKLIAAVEALEAVNSKKKNTLHSRYVQRIVELAFMSVISSWEEFVERTFVRYLSGAKTTSGSAPTLRVGKATSVSHAYQVVSQKPGYDPSKHYLKFTDSTYVVTQAKFYFDKGIPYDCLTSCKDLMSDASAVRNRIAHSSSKSQAEYRTAALRLSVPTSGKLAKGFSPGRLLRAEAKHCFAHVILAKKQTIVLSYLEMLEGLADKIVP